MSAWYAIHDATGRLVSTGTVLPEKLPDGLTAKRLGAPIDFARETWDASSKEIVARADDPPPETQKCPTCGGTGEAPRG